MPLILVRELKLREVSELPQSPQLVSRPAGILAHVISWVPGVALAGLAGCP